VLESCQVSFMELASICVLELGKSQENFLLFLNGFGTSRGLIEITEIRFVLKKERRLWK
jgi:hypothetical protein